MKKNKYAILIVFIVLFLFLRIPGLSLPYHQDEWKTARAVEIGAGAASNLYHPPLTQLSYRAAEALFGGAHLRVLPFLFSLFSLFLLYEVVRRRVDRRAALLSVFLYTISFYSVLASHMIDTDGALLPFFFLLSLVCYDRWSERGDLHRRYWLFGFIAALFAGFMVKLSFIIVLGVFIIDYILTHSARLQKREILSLLYGIGAFIGVSVVALLATKFIYPAFQLGAMVDHALLYVHLSGRNYTQIIVQAIKAIEYLSPLLIVPLLLGTRESLVKGRIFIIYLILGGIFYFVLFDFSRGALDKYLMYAIIPLTALVGIVLSPHTVMTRAQLKNSLALGGLLSSGLLALNFFSHTVLPLYPKYEWFTRVFHGEWNILVPFTGGSGPLGFYVSFLFIGGVFFLSFIFAALGKTRILPMSFVVTILIMLGVSYNIVFAEEYQWGMINGNAPQVLKEVVDYIKGDSTVTSVITYNDIGAYELSLLNKYKNRFYAVPEYEEYHKELFDKYSGHVMVIGIPRLYESGFYKSYLDTCPVVFMDSDKAVSATLYDCRTP